MGLGCFLFVVAVVVLASLQYRIDQNCVNKDYENWKRNRR
jgi:hypothetical protein